MKELPSHKLQATYDEIRQAIASLAVRIRAEYRHREPHLLIVLDGALYFGADLSRALDIPHTYSFIKTSAYGDRTSHKGYVEMQQETLLNYHGKDVIITDDIIDTGLTADAIAEYLDAPHRRPDSIAAVSMFTRRYVSPQTQINLHSRTRYLDTALIIDHTDFLVGYGMDYHNHYRNTPHVMRLVTPNENPIPLKKTEPTE